jgi:hypothetical protein
MKTKLENRRLFLGPFLELKSFQNVVVTISIKLILGIINKRNKKKTSAFTF